MKYFFFWSSGGIRTESEKEREREEEKSPTAGAVD